MDNQTIVDEESTAGQSVSVNPLEDRVLMAELAYKADNAARHRKLRAYGYEATDVVNEVAVEIWGAHARGIPFEDIVADKVKGRSPAITDFSSKDAISLTLGKMCAAAAERLVWRAKAERPIGDATAVTGEEVPSEQRVQSEEDRTRGNDKQMAAILARRAVSRGIHRADVYGVADWSRRAMADNITRSMQEYDLELMRDILDDPYWLPETDIQREAWLMAYGGHAVGDILFGMDPDTEAMPGEPDKVVHEAPDWTQTPCVHRVVKRRTASQKYAVLLKVDDEDSTHVVPTPDEPATAVTYDKPGGQWKCCYYHDKMAAGLVVPYSVSVLNPDVPVYPTTFPYKPLKLTVQHSKRTVLDPAKCRHCDQTHPEGERRLAAAARYEAANPGKKYEPPTPSKNCPPGKVIQWRSLALSGILPEWASASTTTALWRAMDNYAKHARRMLSEAYSVQADIMVRNEQVRLMVEDLHGIGQGIPKQYETVRLSHTTLIFPDEPDSAKDGRRWSLMPGLGETDFWDAYTQTIAQCTYTAMAPMPGADRWKGTMMDMMTGPILVSRNGNMWIDGVVGTFVYGLDGLTEWNRNVSEGRKLVRTLVALRSVFSTMLAS